MTNKLIIEVSLREHVDFEQIFFPADNAINIVGNRIIYNVEMTEDDAAQLQVNRNLREFLRSITDNTYIPIRRIKLKIPFDHRKDSREIIRDELPECDDIELSYNQTSSKQGNNHLLTASHFDFLRIPYPKSLTFRNFRFESSSVSEKDYRFSTCESLDFSFNKISSDYLEYMAQFLNDQEEVQTKVTSLSLSNCGIEACSFLFKVLESNNNTLKSLDISGNEYTKPSIDKLIIMIRKNTSIEEINLSSIKFTGSQQWKLFEALKANKTIKTLDMSGFEFLDNFFESFCNFVSNAKNITTLRFDDINLSQNNQTKLNHALEKRNSDLTEGQMRLTITRRTFDIPKPITVDIPKPITETTSGNLNEGFEETQPKIRYGVPRTTFKISDTENGGNNNDSTSLIRR